jgi:hypothetical protein
MKCVCKVTHFSGKNHYIIDQKYSYYINDFQPIKKIGDELIPEKYRVYNIPHEISNIYLPKDFAKHFIDIGELRELKLNSILN